MTDFGLDDLIVNDKQRRQTLRWHGLLEDAEERNTIEEEKTHCYKEEKGKEVK